MYGIQIYCKRIIGADRCRVIKEIERAVGRGWGGDALQFNGCLGSCAGGPERRGVKDMIDRPNQPQELSPFVLAEPVIGQARLIAYGAGSIRMEPGRCSRQLSAAADLGFLLTKGFLLSKFIPSLLHTTHDTRHKTHTTQQKKKNEAIRRAAEGPAAVVLKADNKYMSRFEAEKAKADKDKVIKDRKRKAEARARSNTDMKARGNLFNFYSYACFN